MISQALNMELFVYYVLHAQKNQATRLKYKKVAFNNLEAAISLIKLQSNSSCQIWRQASTKIIYNVQPDWSNQIITVYLIGWRKPWSDMISFHCSEMISYHFTGIIFSHGFVTLISTHSM